MRVPLASFQWMLFILMGSIVIPVAVGSTYGLTGDVLVTFVSRTLFVLGVAGIIQVFWGHKMPIIEGPAGVWWAVFVLYLGIGGAMFGPGNEDNIQTLRVLGFCFILSGFVFILFAYLGWIEKIAKLFTPTIIGVYLLLMVVQLSGTFVKGMMGVNAPGDTVDLLVMILSIITVASAFYVKRFKSVAAYSTLISIAVGWGLFILFGKGNPVVPTDTYFQLPEILPFGMPRIELGMIVNVVLLTVLLITNLMASVKAVQVTLETFNIQPENHLKETGIVSGLIHIMAGAFGAIGPVPISGSAAFIAQTRITEKLPFILGNVLIIAISLSPKVTAIFAALPTAVGFAALVPTFGFGTIIIAKNQLALAKYPDIRNFVAAAAWFIGIGIMFMPSSAFSEMSALTVSILSNGLIVGTAFAIILERAMLRKRQHEETGIAPEPITIASVIAALKGLVSKAEAHHAEAKEHAKESKVMPVETLEGFISDEEVDVVKSATMVADKSDQSVTSNDQSVASNDHHSEDPKATDVQSKDVKSEDVKSDDRGSKSVKAVKTGKSESKKSKKS